MSILLLNEDEVRQLLRMDDAIDAVETVLRKHALDEAQNIPRTRCQTDHAMMHVLSASAKGLNAMGYKAYCTSKQGANFHVGLFDGKTGQLQAILQADWLGQVRTGAASGVATKHLARPDAATVGLFGAGKQACTQLLAVCAVRKIRSISVYGRDEQRRVQFCQEMTALCHCDVVPVAQPELAARDMDIIVTATSSRDPVLRGEWIADGTHLNVVGSNFLSKAEIDVAAVKRAGKIFVDSKDQARQEAGDFAAALENGSLQWSNVHELGQLLTGRAIGRESPGEVTLFKSLGIGLEDVAVAARVVAKAKAEGVGRVVEW